MQKCVMLSMMQSKLIMFTKAQKIKEINELKLVKMTEILILASTNYKM
jgi:hypothetical protein